MLISKDPSAWIVRYAAGTDWRKVDVGVIGDRNERTILTGAEDPFGGAIEYDRFVVEASKVAPRYVGKAIL